MIARCSAWWGRVRRWFSRSEWAVRLLGLSKSRHTATKPGLLLIQIDGLSRKQLEAALAKGRMPFLKRLLEKEGYRLHNVYSGLPSSTPAFQGELFYGQKCAVPAFRFRDAKSGLVGRMFEPDTAARVQQRLSWDDPGLLQGGSAYCNIYSGGAAEPHFCAATVGWSGMLSPWHWLSIAWLALWHGWSLLRVSALMVIELGLALVDCYRGLTAGQNLWKELKFIPSRVGVTIAMRELATIGATMDVTRGLPVVHLNFLGYDEQAHRRGPASAFAHWSLAGIDNAIKRLWRAARQSPRRDYDVWIYSDHGQEATCPYPVLHGGRTVQEAVGQVLGSRRAKETQETQAIRGAQATRAAWLGHSRLARILSRNPVNNELDSKYINDYYDRFALAVPAMGPVGHIYPPEELEPGECEVLARALVDEAQIPMVLLAVDQDAAKVFTAAGTFELPEQAAEVLGADHPFLEEVARDLVELCHHPDSGRFVFCGWRVDGPPISFPHENGAHAGPGPDETGAFGLLPSDTPLPHRQRPYLRGLDLRKAALHFLGRTPLASIAPHFEERHKQHALRIMTYNVHGCVGMDGKLSPSRIARVISQCDVDIVALQELDVGRLRSGEVDQAHAIASLLEMEFHFHPAWQIEEEQSYGNAILSRYPLRLVHRGELPGLPSRPNLEPRGALWVELEVDDLAVQLLTTHLGLLPREQLAQVQALLGPEWLGHPDFRSPAIVCGDFNSPPWSRPYRRLRQKLPDAQLLLGGHRPRPTFISRQPFNRIDHVFLSPGIPVRQIVVPQTDLACIASDHLPLVVELSIDPLHQLTEAQQQDSRSSRIRDQAAATSGMQRA